MHSRTDRVLCRPFIRTTGMKIAACVPLREPLDVNLIVSFVVVPWKPGLHTEVIEVS